METSSPTEEQTGAVRRQCPTLDFGAGQDPSVRGSSLTPVENAGQGAPEKSKDGQSRLEAGQRK